MTNHSSLVTHQPSVPFYVTGGTLSRDAQSYVTRQADNDLYEGLAQGQFCYVLTSRQMGKSSLMVRTAARLREAGAGVVLLDLTAIGQNLTAEQWYNGLLTQIGQQLELDDELEDFWEAHPKLGSLQRWTQAIRRALLPRYMGPVVIFVDEIDAVRSLPFSTDEFFAAIREFYNRRTEDEELRRLTFCLLGVAAPSDLIRDTRTTPFNVGRRIELSDFTEAEAAPLVEGFRQSTKAAGLLNRILHWTNGHPYLTQRLCQAVAEEAEGATTDEVDGLCRELFLTYQAQERDDNLLFVRERLLRSEVDLAGLLTVYSEALARKQAPDDVTNPLITTLRLSGVTRSENGLLKVRNRIYEQVFGREWVKENMPDAELRRQRAAFRRGLLRAAAIAALIIAAIGSLAFVALWQRKRAEQQEQANRRLLYSAHMNLAARDWENSSIERMRELLNFHAPDPGQKDLRGFEWYLLWSLCHGDRYTIYTPSILTSISFSPDGGVLATAESEGDTPIKLWDASTGRTLGALEGTDLGKVAFSPDGKLIASASEEHVIYLWDASTRRKIRSLKGHAAQTEDFVFSPNGRSIASASYDRTAKLWDVTTGELLTTFKGHTDWVNSVAFSRDGRKVATGSNDQTVKIWDLETGKEMMTLKRHPAQTPSPPPWIWQIAFSPDGSRILAVGNFSSIAVWDAITGRALPALTGHKSINYALAFSPDGKILATGGDDRAVFLWDVGDWKLIKTISAHGAAIGAVAFSPDSKTLATASRDKTVKLWDVAASSNPMIRPLGKQALSIAYSPDGRKLAATTGEEKRVKLLDVTNWQEIATFEGHKDWTSSVAFSPDGRKLVTGSWDKTAKLWDVATGKELLTFSGHTDQVHVVAFSPDGGMLATGGKDKSVRLWEASTAREIAKIEGHENEVYGVAFSPDGQTLATGGWDAKAKLWKVATRSELATLRGHTSWVYRVAFSPDGKMLATASADGSVKLWDVATGKELNTFKGHAGAVISVAFSPDGGRLASAGSDFSVRLWDVSNGQELVALTRHTAPIWALAFSVDGNTLISGANDGLLIAWRAATAQEVLARRR